MGQLADQERGDVEVELTGVLERENLELRLTLTPGNAVVPIGPLGPVGEGNEVEWFQPAAASL
jgi:hypothetical protein